DPAAAGRGHVGMDGAHRPPRALDARGPRAVELRVGDVGERRARPEAVGVVDEDVDPSEAPDGRGHHGLDIVFAYYVGRLGERVAARRCDLLRRSRPAVRVYLCVAVP